MSATGALSSIHLHGEVAYGSKEVSAYIEYSASGHGPDGALFLDRYFTPVIENLEGEKVLDIGCGAATWSIYAAHNGGEVYGIDVQPEMIEAAQKKIESIKGLARIRLSLGTASQLDFESDFFDREISICVSCNLPSGIFEESFNEISRTLKKGGIAVLGVPNSLDIVFTDGSLSEEETCKHIKSVLKTIPLNPSNKAICENLGKLTEVLSATFYIKNGQLTLLTNESDLLEGEKIWRKLPKPIVPNRYHSKESYLQAFERSRLQITRALFPHFRTDTDRIAYNATAKPEEQLGAEYVAHAPFAIYYLEKA